MPPKKKETDDEKEAKFAKWKDDSEYAALKKLLDAIEANPECKRIETKDIDICSDWTNTLDALKGVLEAFKVPKKTQSK
jgi:hypothetical protein